MLAGPSTGTPNILSLYLNTSINSTAILAAIYSGPNLEVSIIFCHFENQRIGALLQKLMIPLCKQRVTTLPAWSASTKHDNMTGLPLGSGLLLGIISLAQGKKSVQSA